MSIVLIVIFVGGGWPEGRYEQILTILGFGFGGFLVGMMVVMIAMAVGGPIGRFKASVSRTGANFEASDHTDPAPFVTTTTTVTPGATPPVTSPVPQSTKHVDNPEGD
jgi:hypothetical protein